jgi:hypothetical protein
MAFSEAKGIGAPRPARTESPMKTDPSTANADFWNEPCGSQAARMLGVTDASLKSLKIFDDWYFDFYPYLKTYIPFEELKSCYPCRPDDVRFPAEERKSNFGVGRSLDDPSRKSGPISVDPVGCKFSLAPHRKVLGFRSRGHMRRREFITLLGATHRLVAPANRLCR